MTDRGPCATDFYRLYKFFMVDDCCSHERYSVFGKSLCGSPPSALTPHNTTLLRNQTEDVQTELASA